MKRRIHTTIATLLVVFCVCAAVAPVASAKQRPENPTHARICAELLELFESEKAGFEAATKAGNEELAEYYADAAIETFGIADRNGCSWTRTRVVRPESKFGRTVDLVVLGLR